MNHRYAVPPIVPAASALLLAFSAGCSPAPEAPDQAAEKYQPTWQSIQAHQAPEW